MSNPILWQDEVKVQFEAKLKEAAAERRYRRLKRKQPGLRQWLGDRLMVIGRQLQAQVQTKAARPVLGENELIEKSIYHP